MLKEYNIAHWENGIGKKDSHKKFVKFMVQFNEFNDESNNYLLVMC